ncbi:hypothetical protein BpHYR1_019976 [Brachionus plicatilis]|uniref:Uncharacterized protein n=1 Tax=Brachionus plicatilis TaxID=10195 RepID=A0A3M7PQF0_BRAPC|nr:hypothetical protein BpHYR1_019976 [Brachionus plicatilis]
MASQQTSNLLINVLFEQNCSAPKKPLGGPPKCKANVEEDDQCRQKIQSYFCQDYFTVALLYFIN